MVELLGEVNRYGDRYTYRRWHIMDNLDNLFNQELKKNTSTGKLQWVTRYGKRGVGQGFPSSTMCRDTTQSGFKDGQDALDWAAFDVKEPLPKVTAQNQYYNRADLNNAHISAGDGVYRNFSPVNNSGQRNDGTVIYDSVDMNTGGRWCLTAESICLCSGSQTTTSPHGELPVRYGTGDDHRGDVRYQDGGFREKPGLHTMDVIVRSQLFDQAVIDRIQISDEESKENP